MVKPERNCFILYHNFSNQLALLSMEERGILITAIFEYAKNEKILIEMPPMVNMAFSFIKDTLDRDREAYVAKCTQNAENGKKGGRPRKQIFLPETERFSDKAEKADKEKETEKENENDNENENERNKEKGIDPTDAAAGACGRESVQARSAFPFPAPRLSEEAQEFLIKKGIPEDYVTARLERAVKHAKQRNRSVEEILPEWWQADRDRAPWNTRQASTPSASSRLSLPASSFETDDFFQAALDHSLREMGLESLIPERG